MPLTSSATWDELACAYSAPLEEATGFLDSRRVSPRRGGDGGLDGGMEGGLDGGCGGAYPEPSSVAPAPEPP